MMDGEDPSVFDQGPVEVLVQMDLGLIMMGPGAVVWKGVLFFVCDT